MQPSSMQPSVVEPKYSLTHHTVWSSVIDGVLQNTITFMCWWWVHATAHSLDITSFSMILRYAADLLFQTSAYVNFALCLDEQDLSAGSWLPLIIH